MAVSRSAIRLMAVVFSVLAEACTSQGHQTEKKLKRGDVFREVGVFQHHGGPIKGTPESPRSTKKLHD